jgi:predicted acetyltransferase
MTLTFGTPTEAERTALAPILAHCFGFPAEEAPDWFVRAGHANVRVLQRDRRVIGGLITVPMGQHFGGRSVPMVGIAGVGITPDARGSGVATTLMAETLRDARRNGFAISTLYPATVPLYAGVGYARGGARYEIKIAPQAAATRSRKLPLARVESGDDPDVRSVYARFAATRNGFLDRGPYVWGRLFKPRKGAVETFKATGERGCEGYVVLKHQMGDGVAIASEVLANDFVATTREAAERLLDLMAGYGSIATGVRWWGAAPDLLTSVLADRRHEIRATDYWMLRIVDVERALTARGYPRLVEASLELEVVDELVPENAGRYQLRVRDGAATIARGGQGTTKVDIRGLASLFTGFHDARTLRDLGQLDADESSLERADAIFAGRAPAMSDFF